MAETSTKPYLIRAIHEWCTDNGYTPYVAVAVDARTHVPMEHVRNGEIVLNVSPLATNHLRLGNQLIEFQARFGGVPRELSIPVENVTAIYARENGHGMAFEVPKAPTVEPVDAGAAADDPITEIGNAVIALGVASEQPPTAKPPQLVPVGGDGAGPSKTPASVADGSAGSGDAATATQADDPDRPDPTPGKPRQSRPKLTRVK